MAGTLDTTRVKEWFKRQKMCVCDREGRAWGDLLPRHTFPPRSAVLLSLFPSPAFARCSPASWLGKQIPGVRSVTSKPQGQKVFWDFTIN